MGEPIEIQEFRYDITGLLKAIDALIPPEIAQSLKNCFGKKSTIQEGKSNLAEQLCNLLLDQRYTIVIGRITRGILLPLIVQLCKSEKLLPYDMDRFERVACALSRLIVIMPHALPVVLQLFRCRPCIFERLKQHAIDHVDVELQRRTLTTAHRLLRHFPHIFVNLWDWGTVFLATSSKDEETRWHALQCSQILLKSNDQKTFAENEEKLHFFYLRQIQEEDTADHAALVCQTVSPGNSTSSSGLDCLTLHSKRDKFVMVNTAYRNMRSVAIALCQHSPILLEGYTGCGKTALLDHLASVMDYDKEMIKIHLGDQSDAKVLLGTYVCTEVPGEFRWQMGSLTQAVKQGKWIVVEDIDLAPLDVVSVILPLLETKTLFIASRGETVTAAPGFQLFATRTLIPSSAGKACRPSSHATRLLEKYWLRIHIDPFEKEELCSMLKVRFPSLSNYVSLILKSFENIVDNTTQLNISFSRSLSSRDLFKWCERLQLFVGTTLQSITTKVEALPTNLTDRIILEAQSCFCAMLPSTTEMKSVILKNLCTVWGLPQERSRFFDELYTPTVQTTADLLEIGRISMKITKTKLSQSSRRPYAFALPTLRLLENILVCIRCEESVLLVGETGTGKTSVVQYLAEKLGYDLVVQNLSQQTDSSDILGGFKPIEMRILCIPIKEEFELLFTKTFSKKANQKFLTEAQSAFEKKTWARYFKLLLGAINMAKNKFEERHQSTNTSSFNPGLWERWLILDGKVNRLAKQCEKLQNAFAFSFEEGPLVKAYRTGKWLLLDEINLASAETLECLSSLLEGNGILLTERGDIEPLQPHPDFRIFACMNPPTDVGKKELPPGLRSRFTEFFVDELKRESDLKVIVSAYLKDIVARPPVEEIVKFYLDAKAKVVDLSDGAGHPPHFSLRTLCRALEFVSVIVSKYGFQRSIHEGMIMTFATQLDVKSRNVMTGLIKKYFLKGGSSEIERAPKCPGENFVKFESYWIEMGLETISAQEKFILTPTVKFRLRDLSRIVVAGKYPILIQGPTSSGKTSMVEYLAKKTGHRFVRINNHEHTDLQEYLGSYVSDDDGKLKFKEGILVEACRKGYWIVLDELNLAPSDVLEALNRLLDDNRELFIAETQETIKPHPHFMLFATQNPPGVYGGRKVLSRAFRNRFCELHFDDLPDSELQTILHQRTQIPLSYAEKLILVMKDLQRRRQGTQVFAGKSGFITLRDLFRWAGRQATGYQALAENGYMLLAERLRVIEERQLIKEVIETHIKAKIDPLKMYDCVDEEITPDFENAVKNTIAKFDIVWTSSLKRLFSLVYRCVKYQEPVLLVGETGCGKTTICQLIALLMEKELHILNVHQNTETADFIGGLRPVRGKDHLENEIRNKMQKLLDSDSLPTVSMDSLYQEFQSNSETQKGQDSMEVEPTSISSERKILVAEVESLFAKYRSLFAWNNGPLIDAMEKGEHFLIDEISLAEDSVIERINSVLEPDRIIVIAEKSGDSVTELQAHPDFRILATMNPGGDFGKKELSPAARNRFTEIWVPSFSQRDELQLILQHKSKPEYHAFIPPMLDFVDWIGHLVQLHSVVSLRDYLSWIQFLNCLPETIPPALGFLHGACLTFIDGLGTMTAVNEDAIQALRCEMLRWLCKRVAIIQTIDATLVDAIPDKIQPEAQPNRGIFGMDPFFTPIGQFSPHLTAKYSLAAPTTKKNTMRILRALQLRKSILLEGSPGVGKTSLVEAIAKASGHNIIRINLSDQTDMMDLLGSDVPVENGEPGSFRWAEGSFLKALRNGDWVLLDELNLASQSVLEGLNAVLDHRATVYIPELNQVYPCAPSFRIFACQNPLAQGGGRKGLPKSFLNRFTRVFLEPFQLHDLLYIATRAFPEIDPAMLEKMVAFNSRVHHETMKLGKFGRDGSPWEFNLRDIFRWCQLVQHTGLGPEYFVEMLYLQRMRTMSDRDCIHQILLEETGITLRDNTKLHLSMASDCVAISPWCLQRGRDTNMHALISDPTLAIRQTDIPILQSMMACVQQNWLAILIGSAGCGKTSIVKLLASLCGRKLRQFSMSSSVDTAELLGGFQQIDMARRRQNLLSELEEIVLEFLNTPHPQNTQKTTAKAYNSWNSVLRNLKLNDRNSLFDSEDINSIFRMLDFVLRKSFTSDKLRSQIERYKSLVIEQTQKSAGTLSARFEWVDGILVECIQQGDWILLDNVNFCSPSVLDRLNPLFESPDADLEISERGLVDGKPKIAHRHKDFRMFMTMDPKNGEISRAMRNRGIEICFLDPFTMLSEVDKVKMINKKGIAGYTIPQFLCKMQELPNIAGGARDFRMLLKSASMIVQLLKRGYGVTSAVSESLNILYKEDHSDYIAQHDIEQSGLLELESCSDFRCPGTWPQLYDALSLIRYPTSAACFENSAVLLFFILENISQQKDRAMVSLASNPELLRASTSCILNEDTLGTSTNLLRKLIGNHHNSGVSAEENWGMQQKTFFGVDLRIDADSLINSFVYTILQSPVRCVDSILWFLRAWAERRANGSLRTEKEVTDNLQFMTSAIFSHPVYKLVLERFSLLPIAQKLQLHNCLDVSLHIDSYESSLSSEDRNCFLSYNLHLELFILLCKVVRNRHLRRKWFEGTENILSHKLSPLQQSFNHLQGCLRGDPPSQLVELSYPAINAIEVGFEQFCVECNFNGNGWERVRNCWEDLISIADDLARCMHSHSATTEFSAVAALVSWLRDTIILMQTTWQIRIDDDSSPVSRFIAASQNAGIFEVQSRLWLDGGHPGVIAPQFSSILKDLSLLSNRLSEMQRVFGLHVVSKETRNNLLEAITTLHILSQQKSNSTIASDIWNTVRQECASCFKKTENLDESCCEFSGKKLVPVQDATIMQGLHSYLSVDIPTHHRDLAILLNMALSRSALSVSLFWPTKDICWSIEGGQESNVQKNLLSLESSFEYLWHWNLWSCGRDTYGSAVLWNDTHSNIAWAELERFDAVPLSGISVKEQQLAGWVQHFHNLAWNDVTEDDWCHLYKTMHHLWQFSKEIEGSTDAPSLKTNRESIAKNPRNVAASALQLNQYLCHAVAPVADQFQRLHDYMVNSPPHTTLDWEIARALLWIAVGSSRFELLRPKSHVDPSLFAESRAAFLHQRILKLQDELQVCMLMEITTRGSRENYRILELQRRIAELQKDAAAQLEKITPRPTPRMYDVIYRDILQFSKSYGSCERILLLRDNLVKYARTTILEHENTHLIESTLEEERIWQDQTSHFCQSAATKYPGYEDSLHPVLVSIYQIKHGIKQLSILARKSYNHLCKYLEKVLADTSKYPAKDLEKQLAKYLDSKTQGVISMLLSNNSSNKKHILQSRLLETCLKMCKISLVSFSRCNTASFRLKARDSPSKKTSTLLVVDQLFQVFLSSWRESERLKKEKAEQEAQLYKTRPKTLCDVTDESQDEKEHQMMFPSFFNDFADLEQLPEPGDEYDGSMDANTHGNIAGPNINVEYQPAVGTKEMRYLVESHHDIFRSINFTNYSIDDHELSEILQSQYQTNAALRNIMRKSEYDPSQTLDLDSGLFHLFYTHRNLASLRTEQNVNTQRNKVLSIYTDSFVSEAKLLLPLLQRYSEKLSNLLQQWPDHPVLQQLQQIITRIISVPIAAPLMKFITGLELLLRKTHEWETYASREVSFQQHIHEIGLLVARWRKIELLSWPHILTTKVEQVAHKSDVWWFHIYGILSDMCNGDAKEKVPKLLSTMNDFFRMSNLGEFESRLSLVRAFFVQIWTLKVSTTQDKVESETWLRVAFTLYNMHKYYSQFLPKIQETCKLSIEPLEKELKEFVQLAKWDHVEYYTLQNAVEKSHRKLSKLAKKMEKILIQPVVGLIACDVDNLAVLKANTENSNRNIIHQIENLYNSAILPAMSKSTSNTPISLDSDPISREDLTPAKLHLVERRLCSIAASDIMVPIKDAVCSFAIREIEELSTEILQQTIELRDGDAARQQKQLALTTLLRELKQRGLSFHSVVRVNYQQDMNELLQQPAPIPTENFSPSFLKLWESAEEYYYGCLSKIQMTRELTSAPSKDLNRREVVVSIGLCEHLLSMVLREREASIKLIQQMESLKSARNLFVHLCQRLAEADNLHGSDLPTIASNLIQSSFTFELMIKQISLAFGGHNIVLDNAVRAIEQIHNQIAQAHSHNLSVKQTKCYIKDIQQHMNTILDVLRKQDALAVSGRINACRSIWRDSITRIESHYKNLDELQSLLSVDHRVNNSEELEGVSFSGGNDIVQKVLDSHQTCVVKIQLLAQRIRQVVQSMTKTREVVPDSEEVETNSLENPQPVPLTETVLAEDESYMKGLHEIVLNLLDQVRLPQLLDQMQEMSELCDTLCTSAVAKSEELAYVAMITQNIITLIGPTSGIVEGLLGVAMSSIKSKLKLLHILLGVFATLYKKGFCVKQETKEKKEGTEEEQVDGTGMAEGEGKKDVSKEIEDEEDLLRPNEIPDEKQNEKDTQEEEEGKEMEGEFEGNMYDKDKQEEEQNSSDEEKEEEEQEPESRMEEVDQEKEEIVDEKLWNEEEDEDEDTKPEKDTESSAKASTDEVHEELAAKEQEDEPNSENDKENPEQDDGSKEDEAAESGGEEEEEETGEMQDVQEEDAGKAQEIEKPEEFELPENMELDDEGGPDEDEEGDEEQEEEQEEVADQVDENDEEEIGEKENEDDDELKQEEDENMDVENDDEQPDTGEPDIGEAPEENDDEAQNHEEEFDTDKNIDDQEENENGEAGIQGEEGVAMEMEHKPNEEQKESEGFDDKTQNIPGQHDKEGSATTMESKAAPEHSQSQQSTPNVNPYRSLGDAKKEWKRRLNLQENEKALPQEPNNEENQDNREQEENPADEYQFVNENEKSDTQALADATEEQAKEQSEVFRMKQEEEEKGEEAEEEHHEQHKKEAEKSGEDENELRENTRLKNEENEDMEEVDDNVGDQVDLEPLPEPKDEDEPMEQEQRKSMVVSQKSSASTTDSQQVDLLAEKMSLQDIQRLRDEAMAYTTYATTAAFEMKAVELWSHYQRLTDVMAQDLCEQLRLILEPTQATKLQGDFRTGKRLNMRKVIPYIASQFRKDKIWLRRTKPFKRNYQVLLAIDNSESMANNKVGHLACESLVLVARAFSRLEIGELGILRFGEDVRLLHPFDQPFTDTNGPTVVAQFQFNQKSTDVQSLVRTSAELLQNRRSQYSGTEEQVQLMLIISDGRLSNHQGLARAVKELQKRRVFAVFLLVDSPHSKDSILDLQSVSFSGKDILRAAYLETFPFPFYVVLRDIANLPSMLADSLRQWFEVSQRNVEL